MNKQCIKKLYQSTEIKLRNYYKINKQHIDKWTKNKHHTSTHTAICKTYVSKTSLHAILANLNTRFSEHVKLDYF